MLLSFVLAEASRRCSDTTVTVCTRPPATGRAQAVPFSQYHVQLGGTMDRGVAAAALALACAWHTAASVGKTRGATPPRPTTPTGQPRTGAGPLPTAAATGGQTTTQGGATQAGAGALPQHAWQPVGTAPPAQQHEETTQLPVHQPSTQPQQSQEGQAIDEYTPQHYAGA